MNSNPALSTTLFTILLTQVLVVSISLSLVNAQTPPIGLVGNPNDFRPGPPIPSCNAEFNQGPDDPISGCRVTPGR